MLAKQIRDNLVTADYRGCGFKHQCLIELLLMCEANDAIFMEVGNLSLEEVNDLRKRYSCGPAEVSQR